MISPALKASRRAKGLCPFDGRPAAPFKRCAHCRALKVKASRRFRQRVVKKGFCADCYTEPAKWGERCCDSCIEVRRIKDKARYQAQKAQGLCVWSCGRKARKGFVTCGYCWRWESKRRADEREERVA